MWAAITIAGAQTWIANGTGAPAALELRLGKFNLAEKVRSRPAAGIGDIDPTAHMFYSAGNDMKTGTPMRDRPKPRPVQVLESFRLLSK